MLYSVLFRFGHIRRWDQCAVYILYFKLPVGILAYARSLSNTFNMKYFHGCF